MNIVHVIPISRGVGKETLSYFSALDLPLGSLIKVPLRNRIVPALVISKETVDDLKAQLRNASYAIKKIGRTKVSAIFSPEFVSAAEEAASHYAGSTGSVLSIVTSKPILEHIDKIKLVESKPKTPTASLSHSDLNSEPSILQADEEDRLAHYKSLIREQFARKRSVFFCLPTIQDTKRIFETLPKGIEEYTYVFNSSLGAKELVAAWNKVLAEPHPVLIIATGSFLGISRSDIGTIIVERESSTNYKTQVRPYVDIRTFAEILARKIKARLILGDVLLRTETLWRASTGELAELSSLKFRSVSTAEVKVVDMKRYKTLDVPEFKILGDELQALVSRTKQSNEHLFILAGRRGLAPLTLCGDCGTTVLCNRCKAPVVLHRKGSENIFLCHRCGEERGADEHCRICGSWKLTTLGIGIELIEETLQSMFPNSTLFRIDKDSVKTHRQALAVVSDFYNSPGSILLGTEMALLYLERPIENSGIASIDSMFSIPDFRIHEKIMNILLRMRSLTRRELVIQTRSRDQKIFEYASTGNLMDFYREEVEVRRKLGYPPFSVLIKITAKGERHHVMETMAEIEKTFGEYSPVTFPAFIEMVDGKTIMHALIKFKPTDWPSPPLLEKLLSLPPHISVNVDPENLL